MFHKTKEIKNMKRNENYFVFLFVFLFLFLIHSFFISAASSDTCNLNVSLVNQDPYPATPNDYLKVLLQVTGVDTSACNGARVSLDLSYPFSMDSGTSLQVLKANTYNQDGFSEVWNIPYTLRVDKDALDGDSQLTVRYAPGNWDSNTYLTKKFNISINNYQTNFDAVVQDFTSSEVSIALANIGKYTANAVVVRVPEQQDYTVSSSDGQMVGNLDSGDYTLVSFSLSPKQNLNNRNFSKNSTFTPNEMNQKKDLLIQVYYTDNIGERRIVNMTLPLSMQSSNFSNTTNSNFTRYSTQKKSSFPWIWIGLVTVLVLIILYKKFPKQVKGFLEKLKGKNSKKENQKSQIPDWIKNAKEKK